MSAKSYPVTSVLQLGYVAPGVSDAAAWREFATEVLGFQEKVKTARGSTFYRMDTHHPAEAILCRSILRSAT